MDHPSTASTAGAAAPGHVLRALGLMSGTSLDGIDLALIETDGLGLLRPLSGLMIPYDTALREELRAHLGRAPGPSDGPLIARLTAAYGEAITTFMAREHLGREEIDIIGLHGQTVLHDPARRLSFQLGDGQALADRLGLPLVFDFRRADIEAGGQGAPFAPLFHRALASGLERPLAILNLGGVGNLTFIGRDEALIAFDTGPGNALIDDLMRRRRGIAMDGGGQLAASGQIDEAAVTAMLAHPFFAARPPKSLDRDAFRPAAVDALGDADAAATLTAFTARSVGRALSHLPQPPRRWIVSGGGRHNRTLMAALGAELGVPVEPIERLGLDGDLIEAQAFGYLAVRSLKALPLSLPQTTGVPFPLSGGRLARPGDAPLSQAL